jgi:hypothetical protein
MRPQPCANRLTGNLRGASTQLTAAIGRFNNGKAGDASRSPALESRFAGAVAAAPALRRPVP